MIRGDTSSGADTFLFAESKAVQPMAIARGTAGHHNPVSPKYLGLHKCLGTFLET